MSVKPVSALQLQPEIARMVGMVVADYAHLEMSMYMIFAALTNLQGDEAFSAFYSLRSLHKREELLWREAEGLSFVMKRALRKLIRRFKAAANRRTEIAHSSYYGDEDRIRMMRLVGDRAFIAEVKIEIFERTFNQYRNLEIDLETFLGFVVRDPDRLKALFQSLPLSRLLNKPLEWNRNPAPLPKSKEIALVASRNRLGLSTDETHVRVAVPQINSSDGYR
ncbi:MAG: hypothetical protein V4475_07790 [Pseudomonadota bacterium]